MASLNVRFAEKNFSDNIIFPHQPNGREREDETEKKKMAKWIVCFLALIGGFYMITAFLPHAWLEGISIRGRLVSYGMITLACVFYLATSLKSK